MGFPYDERKELVKPVMDDMRVWIETEGIMYTLNFQIGKASTYVYIRWGNMMKCQDDGRLLGDNNLEGNVIQSIIWEKKNYFFVATT